MGIKISKHDKVKTGDNDNEENQITVINRQNPVRESIVDREKNDRNTITNDKDEKLNSISDLQRVPLVINTSTNRPKFYYYPNKQISTSTTETSFVPTSQFPYKKPKVVLVRPRNSDVEDKAMGINFQQIGLNGATNERSRYARYASSVAPNPGVQPEHRVYISKVPYRTRQSVNDRGWASTHVLPTNSYTPDRIIPHRTVAELRRSAITCPTVDTNYFSSERFPSHCVEIEPGVNRPPTPIPSSWFPARRTNDYLVASSLLAGEHDLDRRRALARDIHDF